MIETVFAACIGILFIAGSTQIGNAFIAALQLIAGLWFAIATILMMWRSSRK
jgi:hypothetical protein